jgi:hypothetical protein
VLLYGENSSNLGAGLDRFVTDIIFGRIVGHSPKYSVTAFRPEDSIANSGKHR